MLTSCALIVAQPERPATGNAAPQRRRGSRRRASPCASRIATYSSSWTLKTIGVRRQQVAHVRAPRCADFDTAAVPAFMKYLREEVQQVGLRRRRLLLGRAPRAVQAAAARDQADADFDQADVALEVGDAPGAVQREFAAAAERQAGHRGDRRHLRVAQRQHRVLQLLLLGPDRLGAAGHEQRQHRLQVGAGGERPAFERARRPDHQALVLAARPARPPSPGRRSRPGRSRSSWSWAKRSRTSSTPAAGSVHSADRLVLEHRRAGACARRRRLAHAAARGTAGAGRPAGPSAARTRRAPATTSPRGWCTPPRCGDRAVEHPAGQRRVDSALPASMSSRDPLRHLLPAGRLPDLERPLLPAEAPAHREVDVARGVGDLLQVQRAVVEGVAQDRPEELRLRVRRFAQQPDALRPGLLLQDPRHGLVGLAGRRHVVAPWPGRGAGCPCRPCGRSRRRSSGRARPCRSAPASTAGVS